MMRMGKEVLWLIRLSIIYVYSVSVGLANDSHNELMGSDQQVARPSVLEGKRLFYEPEHSELLPDATDSPINSVHKEDHLHGVGDSVEPDDDSMNSNATANDGVAPLTLRYDAYIKGAKALHFVVNGKLCNRIDYSERNLDPSQIRLVCSSLDTPGLALRLLRDGKRIQVFSGTIERGVLTPGRKL